MSEVRSPACSIHSVLWADGGVVVAPRIAPALSPIGIPNIAFDGPSVTNPFGCTNRVVSPLPILSTQTVSEPVVAWQVTMSATRPYPLQPQGSTP